MDPPYPLEDAPLMKILSVLLPHLAEGAVVVLERSSRSAEPEWPSGIERFAEKKYGETRLWYLEPA
jgi:16S rRNA (guanine966-N2)-methyltransferase